MSWGSDAFLWLSKTRPSLFRGITTRNKEYFKFQPLIKFFETPLITALLPLNRLDPQQTFVETFKDTRYYETLVEAYLYSMAMVYQ